MKKTLSVFLLLAILVIASIFIAGCSDSTTPADSTSTEPTVTAASVTALYAAGDIVKNPKSSSKAGLLILGYDAGTDTYERAYIYPNTDGSWGYRLDSKTEKVSRSTIETMYTEKSGTIEVSAVPTGRPTTVATTTAATTATTSATVATTTTSSAPAPRISDIEPGSGKTGTTVSITALKGKYFVSGANVSLTKKGETTIVASSVSVSSPELITCKFAIPSDAGTGVWNVVVTNPDKQAYTWQNGFTITQGSSVATTTTTSSTPGTSTKKVTLYSASPMIVYLSGSSTSAQFDVMGTNLSSATNLKLVGSTHTLKGTDGSYASTGTQGARAMFSIPSGYTGDYTLTAIDSSDTVLGTLSEKISIR